MANANVFPAFIRAEYQPNGAFPKMVQDATSSAERIKRQFESDFGQMGQIVKDALTKPLTAAGSLDLGVGQYKAAADAAAMHARGLREVADAARRVADSDPLSPALRRQAQAASAAALEADKLSREAAKQALNMDRLQGELDQTASSTQRLASAQRGMTAASAGSRQAYVGMGQQIADVAIQAQAGTNAFVILGQQGSQLAYQLAGAGGAAGRVATFFAGPWGAALLGAVSIAGLLATKLGDTAAAADNVKFATSAMSDAQSILGNVMDITTGRINTQNAALIALAQAQILVAQVQAKARAAEARRGVQSIQDREFQFSGGMGGGFSVKRRDLDARDVISQQFLAGDMTTKTALERLDNLRLAGKLTEGQFATAAAAVANLGVELENLKVYEDAGKLLEGTGGRNLLKPKKKKRSGKTGMDKAEFGRDASDKIANIADQFSDSPSLLQRQAAALRELDDIQRGLEKRKPPKLDEYLAQLAQARKIVEGSLAKPFADMLETARKQAAVDDLLINGRDLEAEILGRTFTLAKQKGGVTQAEVEAIAEIVTQERLRSIEIDRQRQKQEANLALIDQTQANLRDTVGELLNGKGFGAIGNLFERQFDIYVKGLTDDISEKLFGDAFRQQRLKLLGLDKVDEAGREMAESITKTASSLRRLEVAASGAATALGAPAANDNRSETVDRDIVVTATRNTSKILRDAFKGLLGQAFSEEVASRMAGALTTAFETGAIGGIAGSAFGGNGGKIGRGAGAVLGGVNKLLGSNSPLQGVVTALPQVAAAFQVNAAISSLLGGDQVKNGKVLGVLFPFLTPLLGSALRGSATVGSVGGSLGITGTSGNSKARIKSASGSAESVIDQINAIAEQLGGGLNATAGSASIGIRKKAYVLDPTGRGRTKGAGVINFGKGEDAAVAAARALALDLINDGVITGLRAGSQKLLANAKSLEAGLEKALKFQSVFDRLEAIKDPVGSAIRTLNKEFTGLIGTFNEAGASAQELASLEELYGLERAKVIKEASDSLTGSLKSLIEDLTKGDSGLSLRDRLSNIRADFNPLANTIRAGGAVDYDKFSELARQLIEVQREISGSQTDYFATFDEVLALSRKALGDQQNIVSIGSNTASPFSGSAAPSNASVPVVGAITAMNDNLASILLSINANIANLKLASGGGGGRQAMLNPNIEYF